MKFIDFRTYFPYEESCFLMIHKLRLVMGKRYSIYKFENTIELDEGFYGHRRIRK